jgi:hypothetical protein
MQDGCPWSDLSHAWPPNVKWCEAQLCGWVVEPANTWSNLGYIFIGLGLLIYAAQQKSPLLKWFGWAQIIVGVSSFVYHMAWNFLFQVFDFFGMYVFIGLLLVFNLVRIGRVKREEMWATYGVLVGVLTVITPVMAKAGAPIQLIVLSMILGIFRTEYAARSPAVDYRAFWASFVLIVLAFAFSISDVTRLRCDPEDHIFQGHAIWHILGALSLWASAKHYHQFADKLVAPA